MEFKRCERCGCFFVTDGDVCQNCMPKDKLDIANLQNYFAQNSNYSLDSISLDTGISVKNVSRHINNNFPNITL